MPSSCSFSCSRSLVCRVPRFHAPRIHIGFKDPDFMTITAVWHGVNYPGTSVPPFCVSTSRMPKADCHNGWHHFVFPFSIRLTNHCPRRFSQAGFFLTQNPRGVNEMRDPCTAKHNTRRRNLYIGCSLAEGTFATKHSNRLISPWQKKFCLV